MKLWSTQKSVTPSYLNCGVHTTYAFIVLQCIVKILTLQNCLWLKGRSYYVVYFSVWWREEALTLFHGFWSQKLRNPWKPIIFVFQAPKIVPSWSPIQLKIECLIVTRISYMVSSRLLTLSQLTIMLKESD